MCALSESVAVLYLVAEIVACNITTINRTYNSDMVEQGIESYLVWNPPLARVLSGV
jgi:hypothetical protein